MVTNMSERQERLRGGGRGVLISAPIWVLLVAVFWPGLALCSEAAMKPVRIGVLVKRSPTRSMERWGPTAEYLSTQILGYKFSIVPLGFDEVEPAAGCGDVDFLLASPAHYVVMEHCYGANRIATLKNMQAGKTLTILGGVIFRRADRTDIKTLRDLHGKIFMSINKKAFGPWMAIRRELLQYNIDPCRDFAEVHFTNSLDAVVYAVRDGQADAGGVRTDTLELMAMEGKIRLKDFYIFPHQHLGSQPHHDYSSFPFKHTTDTYPEWPLAKMKHTPDALAEKVAVALIQMPPDSQAAKAGRCSGWTVPLNYQSVHECLKAIRVHPYTDYGEITIRQVVRQHWISAASLLGLMLAGILFAVYAIRNRRRIRAAMGICRESEKKHRDLYRMIRLMSDNLPISIWTKDLHGKYMFANKACCDGLFNAKDTNEPIGKTDLYFAEREKQSHPENPDYHTFGKTCTDSDNAVLKARKAIRTEESGNIRGEFVVLDVLKTPFWNKEGELIGTVGYGVDITRAKELEKERRETAEALAQSKERLRQSQKMESIGQLAGGIAHDFNNILTSILGNSELLKKALPDNTKQVQFADEIIKSAHRAAHITRQLLTFARKDKREITAVDIHNLIEDTTEILIHGIDKRIKMRSDLQAAFCTISGDATQIANMLLNLGINAGDAMEQGGEMIIATKNVLVEKNYHNHSFELTPGQYIEISITDTGVGMDRQVREKIFEPFFTTKEVDKGTGLGLSSVFGCVKDHKGNIHVDSEPGRGTTFTIMLPIDGGIPQVRAKNDEADKFQGGTGHILIVDDEEAIRRFASASLKNLGYTTSSCSDGAQALAYYREHHQEIKLIILDMTMPKMNGLETFRELKKIQPGVKVLVMSGLSQSKTTQQLLTEGAKGLLDKPFQIDKLSRTVAKIISDDD